MPAETHIVQRRIGARTHTSTLFKSTEDYKYTDEQEIFVTGVAVVLHFGHKRCTGEGTVGLIIALTKLAREHT